MPRERKLMVRMTEAQHKAVRVKAAESGRPVSEIVRELLAAWVKGDIILPVPESEGESQEQE